MKKNKNPRREQLERLKKYYEIHGDGIARLNLKKVITDEDFRKSIKRISDLDI